MSDPQEKRRNATRRHRDEVAVQRQLKIAKGAYYVGDRDDHPAIREPHRLAKRHAMDCGRPGCMLCGNPRKTMKELTQQEKSFYQDLDNMRDTHSNGLPPKDEE